jgi:hypothetical protein
MAMDDLVVREQVREALGTVRPLVTMSRDGLVLTALEWGVARDAAYATATAAAREGALELREQGGGTVPAIEAVTKDRPVVIFAGDTVIGGKQNRIINVTVWLAAMKVTSIPVSCLEMGRWNQGRLFRASRKVDYLLRAKMSAQLADVAMLEQAQAARAPGGTRVTRRSYSARQGEVWREIADKEERAHARSRTSALHDLYEREAVDTSAFVRAFPCPAGASGVAVGVGGRLVALELFDAASTLAEQWPRLVEGAASAWADHRRAVAAGLEPAPRHRHPDDGALGRLLGRAGDACGDAVVGASVGEGWDMRLRGTRVRGGALLVEGHPVHVELFRVAEEPAGTGG